MAQTRQVVTVATRRTAVSTHRALQLERGEAATEAEMEAEAMVAESEKAELAETDIRGA